MTDHEPLVNLKYWWEFQATPRLENFKKFIAPSPPRYIGNFQSPLCPPPLISSLDSSSSPLGILNELSLSIYM